jgi:glycosyltransferase involved in cell wall biosynthesis
MIQKSNPKVAIVGNWLYKDRGAERVMQVLTEIYPQADIYALFGNREYTDRAFKGHDVHFSWLNKLPFTERLYRLTLPFWPLATESLKLTSYDLIISVSASTVHGVIQGVGSLHVNYMLSPMRYLWDLKDIYLDKYPSFLRYLVAPFLHYLRIWDSGAIHQPDRDIAISKFVTKRLKNYYGVDADDVIYPPVNVADCVRNKGKGDYLLALSPFEENKGAEEAVKFAIKVGIPLKLTGEGQTRDVLEKQYFRSSLIQFLGWVSEESKYKLLSNAKALLFLGKEDFGLSAVEALASGIPVIIKDKASFEDLKHFGEVCEDLCGIVGDALSEDEKKDYILIKPYEKEFYEEKLGVERFKKEFSDYIVKVLDH